MKEQLESIWTTATPSDQFFWASGARAMAVPIALEFEDESGFHTPENISVPMDDAWGEEAQRLLRQHRLSCDLEAVRRDQKPQRRFKRPFETLETAFQVTCQVMVALLSPRVHPWMRRLSACLRMQRTYPEVLPSPSLSVFVSGFHAKLVLDVVTVMASEGSKTG
eukprot:s809_g7.t1